MFHDENPINGHFEPLLHKENNNMHSCSDKQVKCSLEHVSIEHRINEKSIPIQDTLENRFKTHRKQLIALVHHEIKILVFESLFQHHRQSKKQL